ncbi:MAG: Transcriptional regulator, AraC family protein [Labilithrix sp.]|nr:Transcriptional regulator, AraC family protein [Labilithrix sp.]
MRLPPPPSDPVAEVISLLRPRAVGGCLLATGPWALRFDPYPHVRFGIVVRGESWLAIEGEAPVLLRPGDFYLLGNPPAYVLASALTVRPRSARALIAASPDGAVRLGPPSEEDSFICGGTFSFDDRNAPLLLDVLPTLVHVRAGDPRGAHFVSLSQLLAAEIETTAAGSSLVIDRLAQVLFVHMLRAHADRPERPAGWLGALRDDRIGAALRAMHADVSHRWTLEELARVAGLSRSAFAASFKGQVGTAPLEYLIEWRMAVARDALRHGTRSISELAFAVGYESESAFSTAFRRVVGIPPKRFRAESRAG